MEEAENENRVKSGVLGESRKKPKHLYMNIKGEVYINIILNFA